MLPKHARHIEGRIGHAFTLGDAAAVFADRTSLEQEHGREALRYYLLYLRRSGYVHFEGFGDSLGAPVTVLADLKHPPSAELERAAPGGPFNVRLIARGGRLAAVSYDGELLRELRPLRPGESEQLR